VEDLNPYAPSKSDTVADAPKSSGWEVSGGSLFVIRDAILPMIDPYTGERAERMTLYRLAVRRRLLWARFLTWGCLLAIIFSQALVWIFSSGLLGRLCIVGFFAGLVAPVFYAPVRLGVFVAPSSMKRRRLVTRFVVGSALAGLALLVSLGFAPLQEFVMSLLALSLGVMLLTAIGARLFQRRLICVGHENGLFEIRGLHPRALETLGKYQK